MIIRTLIIEDEPLARETLRDFLAEFDWLALVGEAADGSAATRLVDELKPDLVFLDVQMPELSGLEVMRRASHRPAIIFTTAFDDYALAAFELEAVDYLQKPFGRERFRQTVERVRRRLVNNPVKAVSNIEKFSPTLDQDGLLKRLFVRDRQQRIVPLQTTEIVWLKADDDYTTVHTEHKQFLVSMTLNEFSRRLDPERFLRVHRSAIVNLDQISQIEETDRRLLLHLNDGAEVQASRAGSQILKKLIA